MERLARVNCLAIYPLTVFATDGDMVAFKYDSGGYGWAQRSSFVLLEDAEREVEARRVAAERLGQDENARIEQQLRKEIVAKRAELERLEWHLDSLRARMQEV